MFKGRGKENKVRPSTQKTEPLNAVNKNYTLCTKKERWKHTAEVSQPRLHIQEQNPVLIRLWKNILDHRTRIFFQSSIAGRSPLKVFPQKPTKN